MIKNKINIYSAIAMLVMVLISNPSIKAQDPAFLESATSTTPIPNIQFSVQTSCSAPGKHKDDSALCLNPDEVTVMRGSSVNNAKVTVNVDGVGTLFTSWSVDVTDSLGNIEHFGPIRGDKIIISGSAILQNNNDGKYKIVVIGQTKSGNAITREGSFTLVHKTQPNQPEQIVSILFYYRDQM